MTTLTVTPPTAPNRASVIADYFAVVKRYFRQPGDSDENCGLVAQMAAYGQALGSLTAAEVQQAERDDIYNLNAFYAR